MRDEFSFFTTRAISSFTFLKLKPRMLLAVRGLGIVFFKKGAHATLRRFSSFGICLRWYAREFFTSTTS